MVFSQKGPAVGGVMGIKPAQLGLLQIGDSHQAVEVFQQGVLVQRWKGGKGRGIQVSRRDARLFKGLPVVGGVIPGVMEKLPQPFLLQGAEPGRGKPLVPLSSVEVPKGF